MKHLTIFLLIVLANISLVTRTADASGPVLGISIARGVSSDGDDGLLYVYATNAKGGAATGRLIISEVSPCRQVYQTYDFDVEFEDGVPGVEPIPLNFGVPDVSCMGTYYLSGIFVGNDGTTPYTVVSFKFSNNADSPND